MHILASSVFLFLTAWFFNNMYRNIAMLASTHFHRSKESRPTAIWSHELISPFLVDSSHKHLIGGNLIGCNAQILNGWSNTDRPDKRTLNFAIEKRVRAASQNKQGRSRVVRTKSDGWWISGDFLLLLGLFLGFHHKDGFILGVWIRKPHKYIRPIGPTPMKIEEQGMRDTGKWFSINISKILNVSAIPKFVYRITLKYITMRWLKWLRLLAVPS